MFRRRFGKDNSIIPGVYFYAPLVTDKLPTISYDGNLSVDLQGTCAIQNGELNFPNINAGTGIRWGTSFPYKQNVTVSAYLTRRSNGGHQISMYCAAPEFSGYAYFELLNTVGVRSNPVLTGTNYDFATPAVPLNIKTFVSISIIYNSDQSVTIRQHWNGVLQRENTLTPSNLDEYIANYPKSNIGLALPTGSSSGSNGFLGSISHYSVLPVLSDAQILELYAKGGIVE